MPFEAVAPETLPVTVPIVQLNVVPATELLSAMLVAVPLHSVSRLVVVTSGVGLTVTIILLVIPGHELAVGVTIYVTVPAVVPGLVSTCDIAGPLFAVAPVIPPVIAPIVQLYVAPATLLLRVMFVLVALHIVVGPVYVTFGVGLTVTTMSTGAPGHEFASGVTL